MGRAETVLRAQGVWSQIKALNRMVSYMSGVRMMAHAMLPSTAPCPTTGPCACETHITAQHMPPQKPALALPGPVLVPASFGSSARIFRLSSCQLLGSR